MLNFNIQRMNSRFVGFAGNVETKTDKTDIW